MASILGILAGVDDLPFPGGDGTNRIRGINPDGIHSVLVNWDEGLYESGTPLNPSGLGKTENEAISESMNLTAELAADFTQWLDDFNHNVATGATLNPSNSARRTKAIFAGLEQGLLGRITGDTPQANLDVARLELDWPAR